MNTQELFDHCVEYYKGRLSKHGGVFIRGWGSPKDPEQRCAIGSLHTKPAECQWDFISYCSNLYGSAVNTRSLAFYVMANNDDLQDLCLKYSYSLRSKIDLVANMLKCIAQEFKLNFNYHEFLDDFQNVEEELEEDEEVFEYA